MIKASKRNDYITDEKGRVYTYLNSQYAKKHNKIYKIKDEKYSVNCILIDCTTPLLKKIEAFKQNAEELGCAVHLNENFVFASEDHLDLIWQRGAESKNGFVGSVKYKNYSVDINISKAVELVIFDGYYKTHYSTDEDNLSSLFAIVGNDENLEKQKAQGQLTIEKHNCVEFEVETPWGQYIRINNFPEKNIMKLFESPSLYIYIIEKIIKERKDNNEKGFTVFDFDFSDFFNK